jgi:hypothetical protein
MTEHILCDIDWDMPAAIMDSDCVPHHLGKDRARATPGPDDLFFTFLVHRFNSLKQFRLNEWALFQRT